MSLDPITVKRDKPGLDASRPKNAAAFIEQHGACDSAPQWVVVETLAPYYPNAKQYPVEGTSEPMTKPAAWAALERVQREEPDRALSIRKTAQILSVTPG